MKSILPYIIGFIVGVLLCVILWEKGCNNSSSEIRLQDSLRIERALNDTIKIVKDNIAHRYDSVSAKKTKDSATYVYKLDSLNKAYMGLKSRFSDTKDSLFSLNSRLKQLANNSNDTDLKEVVSRLGDELNDANNQLFYIQINRDSSSNLKDSEIVRLNNVIVELQSEIKQLKDLVNQCTANTDKVTAQLQETLNRLKKRRLITRISEGLNIVLGLIAIIK